MKVNKIIEQTGHKIRTYMLINLEEEEDRVGLLTCDGWERGVLNLFKKKKKIKP